MLLSLVGGHDDRLDMTSLSICESNDSKGDAIEPDPIDDSPLRISPELLKGTRDEPTMAKSTSTPSSIELMVQTVDWRLRQGGWSNCDDTSAPLSAPVLLQGESAWTNAALVVVDVAQSVVWNVAWPLNDCSRGRERAASALCRRRPRGSPDVDARHLSSKS